MTNEEAIFCEKSYIGETNCTDCKYYGTNTCRSRESHKMAIKALEQELCEDRKQKLEKEYLFESLCEDLKKLQAENEKLRKVLELDTYEDCIRRSEVVEVMHKMWGTSGELLDEIMAIPPVYS